MKFKNTVLYSAILSASLGLAGCSSSSTPSSATDITVFGRITGFGSVITGGVEYETDKTSIKKDGLAVVNGDRDLQVGMVITLKGTANGTQGEASSIEYNDELEGLVQTNDLATGGDLIVMGQNVTFDANTNFESDDPAITAIEDIPVNAVVEVSGYPDAKGNILATYIELKAATADLYDDDMEVKGIITNLNDTVDSLTFDLGGLTVDATSIALVLEFPLANDLYVEVKSKEGFDALTGSLVASKIELEDEGHYGVSGDDGDEMEIEGVITKIDTVNGIIELNGQVINIPAGMDISSFAVDDLVEIEVRVAVDGSLIAEEIEAEDAHDDDEDFTIEALVEAIDAVNGTITADGKVISIDKLNAIMIDHGEMHEKYFSIDSLAVGDWVELEVYIDDAGNYVAIKVERIKAQI
jgi:hypothetical protein